MCDLWKDIGGDTVLPGTSEEGPTPAAGEAGVQEMEERAPRKTAIVGRKVRLELSIPEQAYQYSFRGPRSHRRVVVTLWEGREAAAREQMLFRIARVFPIPCQQSRLVAHSFRLTTIERA